MDQNEVPKRVFDSICSAEK